MSARRWLVAGFPSSRVRHAVSVRLFERPRDDARVRAACGRLVAPTHRGGGVVLIAEAFEPGAPISCQTCRRIVGSIAAMEDQ